MGSKSGQGSVRDARLNAGLTIEDVIARARVSRPTILRLERGQRSTMFDHEAERRVAKALGVEPDTIAWGAVEDIRGASVSLGALRAERHLLPDEVAAACGVSVRTLLRAEAGVAVHPRSAKAIADHYGVRVTDFYPARRQAAA